MRLRKHAIGLGSMRRFHTAWGGSRRAGLGRDRQHIRRSTVGPSFLKPAVGSRVASAWRTAGIRRPNWPVDRRLCRGAWTFIRT